MNNPTVLVAQGREGCYGRAEMKHWRIPNAPGQATTPYGTAAQDVGRKEGTWVGLSSRRPACQHSLNFCKVWQSLMTKCVSRFAPTNALLVADLMLKSTKP